MDIHQNMNGNYWSACSQDIARSEGWLKKVMLLGLINLVPVFGQMTLYGYAYEWAHKVAWGVHSPLPKKIYGRPNSKMLTWGFFALVIGFVFALVPQLVNSLGSYLANVGATSISSASVFWEHTQHLPVGGIVLGLLGVIVMVVAVVLQLVCIPLGNVGIMRMTIYGRFGAGFQLKKIVKMARHDIEGLVRILGMYLLFSVAIVAVEAIVVTCFVFVVVLVAGVGAVSSVSTSNTAALVSVILLAVMATLPLILLVAWVVSCAHTWLTLLIARAMGYWTMQFDVAQWGGKDDPLPFERVGEPAAAPGTASATGARQPGAAEQAAQQPDAAQQPAAAQPEAAAQLEALEPEAAQQPEAAEPEASAPAQQPAEAQQPEQQPIADEPQDASQPDETDAEAAQQPEVTKPEAAAPEAQQPEASEPAAPEAAAATQPEAAQQSDDGQEHTAS